MECNIMRELNVNEMEEVNGGNLVVVAIVVVKVAQKLAPALKAGATAALSAVAASFGYDLGRN
jgi:hypothetical protein